MLVCLRVKKYPQNSQTNAGVFETESEEIPTELLQKCWCVWEWRNTHRTVKQVHVCFRLKEYPQYCQHVSAISHFREFPPHLIEVRHLLGWVFFLFDFEHENLATQFDHKTSHPWQALQCLLFFGGWLSETFQVWWQAPLPSFGNLNVINVKERWKLKVGCFFVAWSSKLSDCYIHGEYGEPQCFEWV